MPASQFNVIADAVAARLNALLAVESIPVQAYRAYLPVWNLDNDFGATWDPDNPSAPDVVKVACVPAREDLNALTRGLDDFEEAIDVVVVAKVPDASNATLDPLASFADALRDALRGTTIDTGDGGKAAWVGAERIPVYDARALDEDALFLTAITVIFRKAVIRG